MSNPNQFERAEQRKRLRAHLIKLSGLVINIEDVARAVGGDLRHIQDTMSKMASNEPPYLEKVSATVFKVLPAISKYVVKVRSTREEREIDPQQDLPLEPAAAPQQAPLFSIEQLTTMANEHARYRETLISIRNTINEVLGDVPSH